MDLFHANISCNFMTNIYMVMVNFFTDNKGHVHVTLAMGKPNGNSGKFKFHSIFRI